MRGWRAVLSDRLGALFVIAVGLGGLYVASGLTFGNVRQPGSGFYPVVVCVLLTFFSALSLTRADEAVSDAEPVRAGSDSRVWTVVAALALYTWALPKVGFVLCTVGLLLLLLRGVGKVSWVGSTISAVVGSLACYGAFVKLGLPLPAGLLPF